MEMIIGVGSEIILVEKENVVQDTIESQRNIADEEFRISTNINECECWG